MKKLVIVLVVFVGISSYAQHGFDNNRAIGNQFTAEQHATLKSKKMALFLDLNSDQQKKVYNLILKQEQEFATNKAKREKDFSAGKIPTSEEHFAMMDKRLDSKLTFQNDLKSLLTPSQFKIWKKTAEKREASQLKKPKMNRWK